MTSLVCISSDQPMAASIAFVHSDDCVNLSVIDHQGAQHAVHSVRLVQEDEPLPGAITHCKWMPYQVGQARANGAGSDGNVNRAIPESRRKNGTGDNPQPSAEGAATTKSTDAPGT